MKAFMLIFVLVVPVAKAKIGMVLKALSAAFIGSLRRISWQESKVLASESGAWRGGQRNFSLFWFTRAHECCASYHANPMVANM